jgi:predicted Zn finger-like uncharacterized protein
MNVSCTQCQTVFRVDPAKVPVDGVRARCSVCAGVFWVRREAESAAKPMAATAPAPARPAAPAPAPVPAPVAAPAAAPPAPRPAASPAAPFPPPSAAPAVPRPAVVPPPGPAAAPFRPVSPPAPTFAPPAAPRAPAPPAPAAPAPAAAAFAPPGPPASSAPVAPAVSRPKRPTNPFLSQDPEARARRLARALVSDIVVYHPAKRRDGLRDGSLKLLFEEEIRKSWDEYVDQVGKPLADSTTFFTDALNEILADGQPVFP